MIAIVELTDAPSIRLTTNIVNCPIEDVCIGMPVQVVFEQFEDVFLPFFAPVGAAGEEFLERSGFGNKRYVLLPSGLHYRKNADLVLKAWPVIRERVPDLTLVVANHCDPYFAARAATLGESVICTGFVDDDELCALYHGAQVVWFPSRYEGFGMPVLEAMACGAPVVASNSTSLPEVAGDAAVLVDPHSVQDNVEAIQSILDNARLRTSMQRRGLQRAAQFTWSASAARLNEIYLSLL